MLLWGIVFALTSVLLLLVWNRYVSVPEHYVASGEMGECSLQTSRCEVTLGSQERISLEISPRPARVMQPLNIDVTLAELKGSRAVLQVEGISMDMGIQHHELTMQDPARFQGRIILPICSSSQMLWQFNLNIETEEGVVQARYRLETEQ